MFNTTHDAILLIVAALYVLVTIVRALQVPGLQARGLRAAPGALTVPALIAATLAIVAVLW